MRIENFVATFDDAFSEENCDKIIEWFDNEENNAQNDVILLNKLDIDTPRDGRIVNGIGSRKDTSYFLNFDPGTDLGHKLRNAVNDCVKEYIINFPNIESYSQLYNYDLKIQKTPPHGGYHIWHHEHSDHPDSNCRVLVWTVYLNDIPEGEGETEFLYQGIKVNPKKGRISIFPAGFTHLHRGNPPYSQDKYIATGWIKAKVNY